MENKHPQRFALFLAVIQITVLNGCSMSDGARRIMEDIFGLLQTGQRADDRFGLEARESGQGRYWTFRK